MATTESGLVVPDSAVQKTQRVLPGDVVKKVKRFVTDLKAEGIRVLLACAHCGQAMTLVWSDRIEDQQPGGRMTFVCTCSEREVR